ncbi:hypothetical protein E1265_00670 [Streptomyces sp. 8K308]|uniref:hypothetical protein n=1 Tax=Streptomyces sp. 8K308 TaxID=2530388 RepID=UPI001047D346|nr:hypothetical protein [Streptomyces sp. 8K308]TDC27879.1 hypothetical protein E1265_00670 [Streptomyces sp. 8K308]
MEASPRESNGTAEDVPAPPSRLDTETGAELHVDTGPVAGDGYAETVAAPDPAAGGESYEELRPPRRLKLVLFAPIVVLSLLGALMFAFPLAFAFDGAGAVVAMLGLLIGCSAAGWGMMAAGRAGFTWPGLPPRGSGRRPDWRVLALYGLGLVLFALLAVWRVAGLR